MPAPAEIQITVNEAALVRVCTELEIAVPPVRIRTARDKRTLGLQQGKTVTIFYGLSDQAASRLLFVTNEITRTLLHELRHVHQLETWTSEKWAEDERYSYNLKPSEVDANDFADRAGSRYRDLVRVRRQQQSTLGRLSKAESRVRHQV